MQEWWYFFPLVGLEIVGERAESMMFGDCTIMSPDVFEAFTESNLGYKARIPGTRHFHSVLAVRRRGTRSSHELMWSAHERAEQVGAALSLILLLSSSTGDTCALAENLREWERSSFGFSATGEHRLLFDGNKGFGVNHKEPVRMTLAELREVITSEASVGLGQLVYDQSRRSSISEALTASVTRLAAAFVQPDVTELVFGTVTSMEILLTNSGDGFDALSRRIHNLIGPHNAAVLDTTRVLNSRHLYVHAGRRINLHEGVQLVVSAAHLGLNVLASYIQLANRFESKAAILCYLDLLRDVERMRDCDPTFQVELKPHVAGLLEIGWPR